MVVKPILLADMSAFTFTIGGDNFLRDGKPHRIFSGALHYFRVSPQYWEDRLQKYLACGLNTVETYVPWNAHEPRPGEFCFEGMLDLRRFVELAGGLGLDVIIRPGPYICAEWEAGGLPAWLLADRDMRPRTRHPAFIRHTEAYLNRVLNEIDGLACHQGGPVIALQVENEYGSIGNDSDYIQHLASLLARAGLLLFTSDDSSEYTLRGGSVPGLLRTVNFGSRATQAFDRLRKIQPQGPLMCMEFWIGWFDHWGGGHHVRPADDAAAALEEVLQCGASVNIYMMHGGTNFGFMNGANQGDAYRPTISSYDYDAALDERGQPTAKYHAMRSVLAKYGAHTREVPHTPAAKHFGKFNPESFSPLLSQYKHWAEATLSPYTLTMEEVGQNYGYILYKTFVTGPLTELPLTIIGLADQAWIYQDGQWVGSLTRTNAMEGTVKISIGEGGSTLEILVENQGRVNHGYRACDRKGITGGVRLGAQFLANWHIHPLDFSQLPQIEWQPVAADASAGFYRADIEIEDTADTFLRVRGGQGAAWVNGFCLGRYRACGPQHALYVPAPLLRNGLNQFVVFELETGILPELTLQDYAGFHPLAPPRT